MRLVVLKDSIGATGRECLEIRNSSITDALMENFPDGLDTEATTIMLNGQRIKMPVFDENGCMIDPGDEIKLTRKLSDGDVIGVVFETKEVITAVIAIISIIAAVYAYTSIPDIPPPEQDGAKAAAENNKLSGQTNTAKLYEAIPDIYGRQISYPDLMTNEASTFYGTNFTTGSTSANRGKSILQYMCIGIGEYQFNTAPKLGGTPIDQIPGAYWIKHEPDSFFNTTNIPDYEDHFSVDQIEGQELRCPGSEVGIDLEDAVIESGRNEDTVMELFLRELSEDPRNKFSVGDIVLIYNAADITTKDRFDAYLEIISMTATRIYFNIFNIETKEFDYYYEYDSSNDLYRLTDLNNKLKSGFISKKEDRPIGPYDTSSPGHGFIVDVLFQRGLVNRNASIEIEYQEIDKPGGSTVGPLQTQQTVISNPIEDGTTSSCGCSIKIDVTGNVGDQTYDEKYWRVSVKRTNISSSNPAEPDMMKYERLASFRKFDAANQRSFGNVTILEVFIPATPDSLSPRKNKVNVDVTRKTSLPTTNNGAPTPQEGFANAVYHEFVNVFGQDPNLLDVDELFDIQNKLDLQSIGDNLSKFCYTFADADLGLEQRIQKICNTVRVQAFRDGKKWRFVRDEAKDFVSGMITPRDIASERNYSKSWSSRLPSEYDGIRLEYVDPDLNKKAYIYKKYDGSGNIIDEPSLNQKVIPLDGCRNFEQANNRANLEMRRLLYDNFVINDTLLSQGNLYDIGDVVKYADTFQRDVLSGEIKGTEPTRIIILSESVEELDQNKSYLLSYTNELGEVIGPNPIDFTQDPYKVFLAQGDFLQIYTADYANTQLGSRFIISEDVPGKERLYVVKEKRPNGNGDTVDITLSQYDERLYLDD